MQSGFVRCSNNVMLEVEKWLQTRYFGNTMRVRCHTYTYIGWRPSEHLLLKYHNLHPDPDEYHHRVYDPDSGEEILHEVLQRYQFPTFPEVLDELKGSEPRLMSLQGPTPQQVVPTVKTRHSPDTDTPSEFVA